MPPAPITCGIAGWSYPDWEGYVYPPGTRDQLRYVSAYFDVIEINSTFYRSPAPNTVRTWVDRVADRPGFRFTAKLHQDVTHRGRVEGAEATAFRAAMAPLAEAGRLQHLLAQFRYDFDDRPDHRAHLQRIREAYGGLTPLTLELRHNTWQSPRARDFLNALDVAAANLDYPTARDSYTLRLSGTGRHAYLRLHGRNSAAWFSQGAGRDETYNYLYNREELDGIVKRAVEIASLSKSLTLIANNHYRGKEAANALELKSLIAGERVAVPPLLLLHYPRLADIARPGDDG